VGECSLNDTTGKRLASDWQATGKRLASGVAGVSQHGFNHIITVFTMANNTGYIVRVGYDAFGVYGFGRSTEEVCG
jgi:hypothetical protein